MKIRAQVLWQAMALLALLGGPFIPAASADLGGPAAIAYTGTINSGGYIVMNGSTTNVQGDAIKGTFTYSSQANNTNGIYTVSGLNPAPTLTITITALGLTDRYVSSPPAFVATVVSGGSLTLTGETLDSNSFSLKLSGTGYNSLNLPTSSQITADLKPSASQLALTPFNPGIAGPGPIMFPDSPTPGFTANFTATVETVTALPEPSSLITVIISTASASVCFASRRLFRRSRRFEKGPG
jgi:hypothetical protein